MAATSFIALAYFLLYNVLYCRSCISTAIYTSVIGGGERNLPYPKCAEVSKLNAADERTNNAN